MKGIFDHLNGWLHRKEAEKFTENTEGKTAIRITGDTVTKPSGLNIGGQITEIELSDSAWTPLERSASTYPTGSGPLTNRNAISIQNVSGVEIKLNYDNTEVAYSGITMINNAERYYDITDNITIYAKASVGNPKIILEEIA